MTISTSDEVTRFSQANSGMRRRIMPGQRMHRMVVTMLRAVPMLPTPLTSRPMIQ